jgi:tungstate transport system ATP-binding protein
MICFEEVTIAAGNGTLLDALSLSIGAGAPTVLIGPNGAGKTSLLRAAMGLLEPTRGRIAWDGEPRRAIVFQRPVMLRRSAAANIRFAQVGADRTAELLALVGLAHAADRPARRLSAGEQQRLALARALARDPAVLFLDEPTASLDPYTTMAIEDVVRTITARGVKVVMSTHDLGEAKRMGGEIVLLHRGRLVETGPAAAFFASPSTQEARKFIAGELLV